MKKLIVLIFITTIILLYSCKKDYKCRCGIQYSSHGGYPIHNTKKNAIKQCEGNNENLNDTLKCDLGY